MSKEPLYTWYYFGCRYGTGHHLEDRRGNASWFDELMKFDGELCPESRALYQAQLTRLPHLNYSALAWWDQTGDTRPGSNSIIFAPSPTCSLETIRLGMTKWFPWVEARLPQALIILPGEVIYDRCQTKGR